MAKHIDQVEEHYGPYGAHCANIGQFDAGICWICEAESGKITSKEATQLIHERKTRTGRYEYLQAFHPLVA